MSWTVNWPKRTQQPHSNGAFLWNCALDHEFLIENIWLLAQFIFILSTLCKILSRYWMLLQSHCFHNFHNRHAIVVPINVDSKTPCINWLRSMVSITLNKIEHTCTARPTSTCEFIKWITEYSWRDVIETIGKHYSATFLGPPEFFWMCSKSIEKAIATKNHWQRVQTSLIFFGDLKLLQGTVCVHDTEVSDRVMCWLGISDEHTFANLRWQWHQLQVKF